MILVAPKDLDFECSAPIEDLPVWGGGVYQTVAYWTTPPELLVKVVVDETTLDMWGFSGPSTRRIYKKAAADTAFTLVATIGDAGDTIRDIAVDYSGYVYIIYSDYSAVELSVYRIHPVTYEVIGPICSVATDLEIVSLSLDTFLGDIFFSAGAKIYKYTNATGVTAIHYTASETAVVSLAVDPSNKNIYAGTMGPYNILKQTASTGAFAEIASDVDYVYGVAVNWHAQELFCHAQEVGVVAEVFHLPRGETTFVSLGNTPYRIGGMSCDRGTLYFTYESRQGLGVFSDKVFLADAYVIYNENVYLALLDSSGVIPGTDETKWFSYGPTNPGKALDEHLLTRTKGLEDDLYISFLGGDIDTIGLFNVTGTNAVLRVFDGTGVVSTTTTAITSRNLAFNNVAEGLVYEVNITGPIPSLGGLVAGLEENIGDTLRKVNLELVSYSKVGIDEFGRASFTRRGRAKRAIVPLWAQRSEVDRIYELFNVNDAKFCMWQGDLVTPYLLLYGHYKRFDMPLAHLSGVEYSVEILGDVDTSDEVDPFTYALPAFGATRAVLLPDGWTVAVWFNNTAELGPASGAGFSLPGLSTLTYIAGSEGNVFFFQTELYISPTEMPQLTYAEGESAGVVSIYGVDLPDITLTVNNNSEYPVEQSIVSATVDATGTTLTLVFNTAMTQGVWYVDTDFNLDGSIGGADIGLTYVSGSGTDTWVFSIATVIRKNETVDLDYNGRPGGVEDVGGNDLAAVASMAVVNGSTEEYSDIVLWSGFDGYIAGNIYTGTSSDYPLYHTVSFASGANVTTDGTIKKVISSLHAVTGDNDFIFDLSDFPDRNFRFGMWYRPDETYVAVGIFEIFNKTSHDSAFIKLSVNGSTSIKLIADNVNQSAQALTMTIPAQAGIWTFYEVSYTESDRTITVRKDGVTIGTLAMAAAFQTTYPFNAVSCTDCSLLTIDSYCDNLIVSTDPNRDLYALALLEACPRV